MAMSMNEFIEKSGCEICGGNLIVGVGAARKKLGQIHPTGSFELTRFGTDVMEALEQQAEAAQAIADATVAEESRLEAARRGKPLDQQ